MLTYDLNGDQVDEIIGLGVNNAFDQAKAAFTRNPDAMNGHSSFNEEYELERYSKADEEEYIRFPRSIVGDTFTMRLMSNRPFYLQVYEDGLIPFEPDHEYFEVFKDSLLY